MDPVLSVISMSQTVIQAAEWAERQQAYAAAHAAADGRGRPLLNVGCPSTHPFQHPCGDVCLDLDPR